MLADTRGALRIQLALEMHARRPRKVNGDRRFRHAHFQRLAMIANKLAELHIEALAQPEEALPAEMPAAVIERAASPDERVLVTSLGLLAREAQLGGYASPAVIVVGEVVALATVREAELRRCWARCA
jgi:siroheme synthase